MKRCCRCGKEKQIALFTRQGDRFASHCKACQSMATLRWQRDNPDKVRAAYKRKMEEIRSKRPARPLAPARDKEDINKFRRSYWLRRAYSLTDSEYDAMLLAQNNSCAMCGMTEKENGRKLAIDHNHDSGEIRGLLCLRCNAAIGLMGESRDVLFSAIKYLGFCDNA